jgi:hypothetical protein
VILTSATAVPKLRISRRRLAVPCPDRQQSGSRTPPGAVSSGCGQLTRVGWAPVMVAAATTASAGAMPWSRSSGTAPGLVDPSAIRTGVAGSKLFCTQDSAASATSRLAAFRLCRRVGDWRCWRLLLSLRRGRRGLPRLRRPRGHRLNGVSAAAGCARHRRTWCATLAAPATMRRLAHGATGMPSGGRAGPAPTSWTAIGSTGWANSRARAPGGGGGHL